MIKKILICIAVSIVAVAPIEAGQVTMAAADLDGDYVEEIIRSDETDGNTSIRVYKRLDGACFYKPVNVFTVPGRLVQVPEVADVNSDGIMDYSYATGLDIGFIFYQAPTDSFKRSTVEDIMSVDGSSVPTTERDTSETLSSVMLDAIAHDNGTNTQTLPFTSDSTESSGHTPQTSSLL